MYGVKRASSLDDYRHTHATYSRKSLTSDGFLLESLPPTSPAAKLHSYRAYFAVHEWLGNDNIIATDWGWDLFHGRLSPTQTEKAIAPERVLKIVSCGCLWLVESGANVAKLDYIVHICALPVLAKHAKL